ncbi:hypothetical protein BC829DRAFT_424304, partial [Chytridium lagenaria]
MFLLYLFSWRCPYNGEYGDDGDGSEFRLEGIEVGVEGGGGAADGNDGDGAEFRLEGIEVGVEGGDGGADGNDGDDAEFRLNGRIMEDDDSLSISLSPIRAVHKKYTPIENPSRRRPLFRNVLDVGSVKGYANHLPTSPSTSLSYIINACLKDKAALWERIYLEAYGVYSNPVTRYKEKVLGCGIVIKRTRININDISITVAIYPLSLEDILLSGKDFTAVTPLTYNNLIVFDKNGSIVVVKFSTLSIGFCDADLMLRKFLVCLEKAKFAGLSELPNDRCSPNISGYIHFAYWNRTGYKYEEPFPSLDWRGDGKMQQFAIRKNLEYLIKTMRAYAAEALKVFCPLISKALIEMASDTTPDYILDTVGPFSGVAIGINDTIEHHKDRFNMKWCADVEFVMGSFGRGAMEWTNLGFSATLPPGSLLIQR